MQRYIEAPLKGNETGPNQLMQTTKTNLPLDQTFFLTKKKKKAVLNSATDFLGATGIVKTREYRIVNTQGRALVLSILRLSRAFFALFF